MEKSSSVHSLFTIVLGIFLTLVTIVTPVNSAPPASKKSGVQRKGEFIRIVQEPTATQKKATADPSTVRGELSTLSRHDSARDFALIKSLTPPITSVKSGGDFLFTVTMEHRPESKVPFNFTMRPIMVNGQIDEPIFMEVLYMPSQRDEYTFKQSTINRSIKTEGLTPGMYLLTVSQLNGTVVKSALLEVASTARFFGSEGIRGVAYTPITRSVLLPAESRARLTLAQAAVDSTLTVKQGGKYTIETKTDAINYQKDGELQGGKTNNTKVEFQIVKEGDSPNENSWIVIGTLAFEDTITQFTQVAPAMGTYTIYTRRQAKEQGEDPRKATLIVEM